MRLVNMCKGCWCQMRMPIFIGAIESLRCGTGSQPVRFDVVTMNIIPEVILPLLPRVVKLVRRDLILSGILTARRDDVVAACPLPLIAKLDKARLTPL